MSTPHFILPQAFDVPTGAKLAVSIATLFTAILGYRVIFNLYFHPLAKFPGPWYAAVTSFTDALLSYNRQELPWFQGLVKKYGADTPIRIGPNLLLFCRPSALKPIYIDQDTNTKSGIYGSKSLGPQQIFSTRDANEHKAMRKALSAGFSVSALQTTWEDKIDGCIGLIFSKLMAKSRKGEEVDISVKIREFSFDIMTLVSFGQAWGFIENERDENGLIAAFNGALDITAFFCRWTFLRETLQSIPFLMNFLMPNPKDKSGWGYLIGVAHNEVAKREEQLQNGIEPEAMDFTQHCMEARLDGNPLPREMKQSHVTLLIQAGADTTASSLAALLRSLLTHPIALEKARKEIDTAFEKSSISSPVKFQETLNHLPYFVACAKESMRLNPPGSFLFSRVVPKGGKVIDGHFVPGGADVTTLARIVQRDPILYAPDPDSFRPERWLDRKYQSDYDNASFTFGIGTRTCLGKDLSLMEMYKLVPEIIRTFDIELVSAGQFQNAGQVVYLENCLVKFTPRVV